MLAAPLIKQNHFMARPGLIYVLRSLLKKTHHETEHLGLNTSALLLLKKKNLLSAPIRRSSS